MNRSEVDSTQEGGRDTELRAELEAHHADAFGWALSCCGWERGLAEEVLQSTYWKILAGKAVFAGRSSFKTWLFAVIRRTTAEERRRQAIRRFVSLDGAVDRLACVRDSITGAATAPCVRSSTGAARLVDPQPYSAATIAMARAVRC